MANAIFKKNVEIWIGQKNYAILQRNIQTVMEMKTFTEDEKKQIRIFLGSMQLEYPIIIKKDKDGVTLEFKGKAANLGFVKSTRLNTFINANFPDIRRFSIEIINENNYFIHEANAF